MAEPQFFYGGQAVIEGVMIRGRRFFSLAVRKSNGEVYTSCEPLSQLFTGRLRRVPLIRGIIVLLESLTLGMKALNRSASLAVEDQTGGKEEMPPWAMGATLVISFAVGIGIFFLLPFFTVRTLDSSISSEAFTHLIEGLIRMALLVGYISAIGLMPDVRRVFAYHGAEHMAVHAHEAGLPLNLENVRKFPTAHPRCGTAFLLMVMVVSILLFSLIGLLGRPTLEWRILSRVLLIPVIAAASYEVIRFSGAHYTNRLTRAVTYLGILLQSLTTRRPDDQQIEVAISAMDTALAADEDPGRVEKELPELAAETGNSGSEPSPSPSYNVDQ